MGHKQTKKKPPKAHFRPTNASIMRFFQRFGWLFLAFLGACGPSGEPEKKFRIGFAQCCDDAWRDVMNSEMHRELAFHPEIDFEIRVASGNSQTQVEQIRELLASKIDLLIVAPNESEPLTAVLDSAFRSGTPILLIDRKTESEQFTAFIGGDNFAIGQTAAHWIVAKTGGQAEILEVKLQQTISAGAERHRGFREGLKSFQNLRIVGDFEAVGDLGREKDAFLPLLKKWPKATVVYAHTDLLAETFWLEAQKIGRENDLLFIGIDGIPGTGQGIEAVEKGILDASLLYPTGGAEAIKLAVSVLRGLPFQKMNALPTTVIDPTNAAILHAQMRKEAALSANIDKQLREAERLDALRRGQRTFIFVLFSSLLLSVFLGWSFWRSLQQKKAANLQLEAKTAEALEHERQVIAVSDELREAERSRLDFFTNISHEFRTPLTLILGFAEELLPSPKIPKDAQQSLGLIRQNAHRLLRLVNQLMDFRKIESDRMRLRASENDLVEFVRSAMRSFGKEAEKRKIDFQLVSRHERLLVFFDAAMLDKALFNLLSNAFKFTPVDGKIHLSINVDTFENLVKLRVEDSGAGMSEAETAHLFEPFYQGEGRQKAGTGLGLALSKTLVELHGGRLSVSSKKGKGSRFSIDLRLGKEHLRPDQITDEADFFFENEAFLIENEAENDLFAAAENQKRAAEEQILIIEDNADVLDFLKKSLGSTYQILAASDGDAGLRTALDAVPDLVICDIGLPERDGLEIARAMKSDLRTSHVPLILLTARASVEQQIEGQRAGADAYVMKPFNVQFLKETIRNLLHNRQILKESYGRGLLAFSEKGAPREAEKGHALDLAFGEKFRLFVEANHARQDFQVTDLCREMNLSRSQLYRKVKALFGESISDHVQNVRLEKARALLLEGKMSVAEIAYQVGYSSPDYFSTVFRSKYGAPPTAVRKTGRDD